MSDSNTSIFPLMAAIVLSFLSSCDCDSPPKDVLGLSAEQRESFIEKGNAVSANLMKSLSAQLKAALESGGPVAAVSVCQQVAIPISESVAGASEGVTVRRTSLRPRNPANAPDETDRRILQSWQSLSESGTALPEYELLRADGGLVRYYRPILVQAACVTCHGREESFDKELRGLLDRLYPEDKARGYSEGDLRGAVRVEIRM